jgi:hypothetical protein
MGTPKEQKAKETVVGTFKQTTEELENGVTKEIREEVTVTLRRRAPDASRPRLDSGGSNS